MTSKLTSRPTSKPLAYCSLCRRASWSLQSIRDICSRPSMLGLPACGGIYCSAANGMDWIKCQPAVESDKPRNASVVPVMAMAGLSRSRQNSYRQISRFTGDRPTYNRMACSICKLSIEAEPNPRQEGGLSEPLFRVPESGADSEDSQGRHGRRLWECVGPPL